MADEGNRVRPIRSLGQNFLKDRSVVQRIVTESGITENDIVFEIGPGTGALTDFLIKKAGYVIGVEIDKYLMPKLTRRFESETNIAIINADVLGLDFKDGIRGAVLSAGADIDDGIFAKFGRIRIVANLPYYITTPIIMKLLEEMPQPVQMTFMVQKEVALRMSAKPGGKEYGSLSVAVQYYCLPETLFIVPPESFNPKPDVDSAVIRLSPYERPAVETTDKALFFKVVRAAFGQRRKTLANALHNSGVARVGKEEITALLVSMGIDANARGETLTIQQFASLANELCKNY